LPRDQVAEAGLKYLHLQILDFHPPCLEQIDEFIAFIDECKEAGTLALVHCFAGMGRTGTMLACYLGRDQPELTADQAIAQIRKMRPGSIETLSQEDVIHAYFKTRKKN
jgi:atypical dual specificity phosphatase